MRITSDVVRALAGAADDVAPVAAQGPRKYRYGSVYTRSDTDGTVFVASHRQLVWRGRGAVRQAAAYYLGVIDAFTANAYLDLPHHDNAGTRRAGPTEWPDVRDALFQGFTGAVRRAYGDGLDEGNSRRATIARFDGTQTTTESFNYEASQLDRVLSNGPDGETGGVFRIKVSGASVETKWLSVTTAQIQAIREILLNGDAATEA